MKSRIQKLDEIVTKERVTLANQPDKLLKLYEQTLVFYVSNAKDFLELRGLKGCNVGGADDDDDGEDEEEGGGEDDDVLPIFRRKEINKQERAFGSVWDDGFSSQKFFAPSITSFSSSSSRANSIGTRY
jgi:hypothetical protein